MLVSQHASKPFTHGTHVISLVMAACQISVFGTYILPRVDGMSEEWEVQQMCTGHSIVHESRLD